MQMGRGVVYARNGGAASSQPLAVSAAISILKQGGSFIDAAIALSAVLTVVEPAGSHLGGDAFLVTHHAKSKTNLAFNGSGESSHAATPENYVNGVPLHGYKAGTVPGLVSTWFEAHERYGTLPISQLLAQAIDFAENGFPASAGFVRKMEAHLAAYPDTQLFAGLGIKGKIKIGDLIVQKDLARSLKEIAVDGRSAFYEGRIASQLVKGSKGWFSAEDLKAHTTRVLEPLSIKYRDITIYGQPPPSQGMILMEELLINERFSVAELSEADRIHLGVESKKISFVDRYEVLADPEIVAVNTGRILSKDHIDRRVQGISMDSAAVDIAPVSEGSDTTYFLVSDSQGNAVSWIQSVFYAYGSSWVIPETGIILNNRLTGFVIDPKAVNVIAPGKRPAHTLNAFTAVRADGSLYLVGGTPGGNVQVQSNLQLITSIIDLKLSVQEAVEAPRWQHLEAPGLYNEVEAGPGVLQIEDRVPTHVFEELKARGHDVLPLPAWGHGSAAQLMEVLENGTFAFGSDPRCEGHASGL